MSSPRYLAEHARSFALGYVAGWAGAGQAQLTLDSLTRGAQPRSSRTLSLDAEISHELPVTTEALAARFLVSRSESGASAGINFAEGTPSIHLRSDLHVLMANPHSLPILLYVLDNGAPSIGEAQECFALAWPQLFSVVSLLLSRQMLHVVGESLQLSEGGYRLSSALRNSGDLSA